MTDSIAGLPFWQLTFDVQGDPDGPARAALLSETADREITDLFVFAHGWNNDQHTARRLYDGFFTLLAGQLPEDRRGSVGLAGVFWPSKRWSDEPIPDFTPSRANAAPGVAAAVELDAAQAPPATVDQQTLDDLRELFPAATAALDRMAQLLSGPPTDQAQAEFLDRLKEFARLAGTSDGDGEGDPDAGPAMLKDDHATLFGRFRDSLLGLGVELPDGPGGGEAGIGDQLRGIWNGAKEALRQATYWEMKNRAGVVGRAGLGPVIGSLHSAVPQLRVHVIGHSFGARLVSNTLAGLPPATPSPVKSLTLLQGAFSHFAFTDPLPFDAHRHGALAGLQKRVEGPVTVCFSSHDSAVGTFYPLASVAAGEDSAAAHGALYRWGGMGADGAQNADAVLHGIGPAGPDAAYEFSPDRILNIDASEIVSRGGPPSGAHSDIVHEELTWVVLAAAGVV